MSNCMCDEHKDFQGNVGGCPVCWIKERERLQAENAKLKKENEQLLNTCIAGGFIGNGTQLIGDARYRELVTAEAENAKLKEQLQEIAEYAREQRELVCGYANGEKRCDCKYLKGQPFGEQTGCCEFRQIWIMAKEPLEE